MTGLLGAVDLPAPASERWFEDYTPGAVYEFGTSSLSETQIVAFAEAYDPQSIHTDPEWSASGPFGGLIASGVHTIAVSMRLYVDHYISHVASPGLARPRRAPMAATGAPRRSAAHPGHGGRRASRSKPGRDWCTRPSRPSTRTTRSCCRSPR